MHCRRGFKRWRVYVQAVSENKQKRHIDNWRVNIASWRLRDRLQFRFDEPVSRGFHATNTNMSKVRRLLVSVYSAHLDFGGGIPSPYIFVPFLLPSLSFVPLRSRPPLRPGGLGVRISSPSGSGQSHAAKRIFEHFRRKFARFWLLSGEQFSVFIARQKRVSVIFVIHFHGRKKFSAHNLASVWGGNCKFFWEGGNSLLQRCMEETLIHVNSG